MRVAERVRVIDGVLDVVCDGENDRVPDCDAVRERVIEADAVTVRLPERVEVKVLLGDWVTLAVAVSEDDAEGVAICVKELV